ncbi:uncharacterized protein BDR25DRAFT_350131 [Lindgomyces ingoldianus]|uniref:Uncharacterized protein n=1 Tax=Lindgomyces ingoldianus TaxID=673940 RepID=A0ACB6R9M8_9PLEO|nr:uncharacterized protein BDR25DRAFT_350131 [Lindgomyces ingoldianus]KAF2475856.1 hypothetical protein BDR25DRAFT_350131 [Lindgomyces ingoldianus]
MSGINEHYIRALVHQKEGWPTRSGHNLASLNSVGIFLLKPQLSFLLSIELAQAYCSIYNRKWFVTHSNVSYQYYLHSIKTRPCTAHIGFFSNNRLGIADHSSVFTFAPGSSIRLFDHASVHIAACGLLFLATLFQDLTPPSTESCLSVLRLFGEFIDFERDNVIDRFRVDGQEFSASMPASSNFQLINKFEKCFRLALTIFSKHVPEGIALYTRHWRGYHSMKIFIYKYSSTGCEALDDIAHCCCASTFIIFLNVAKLQRRQADLHTLAAVAILKG